MQCIDQYQNNIMHAHYSPCRAPTVIELISTVCIIFIKITKEDFDAKAKGLLGESNVHLHNEFLFAILVKCQTGTAQPGIC